MTYSSGTLGRAIGMAALAILFMLTTAAGAQTLTEYRLGPGDKLGVKVFGNADISGEFEIDSAGYIAFPLAGRLTAAGLTVNELQSGLAEILNRDFIVDPRISIEVLNYRPFFILGEVNKPGSYPYVSGLTVRQAVALGGGFNRRARTSSMTIIRQTPDGHVSLRAKLDDIVFPGDTLEINRRFF